MAPAHLPLIDLTSRVALVTGGVQGIGRATVELFVALGASVVVLDRDDAGLRDLAKSEVGASIRGVTGDVSNAEDAQRAVELAVEEFGRLDILVSNAGITRDELLFRMTDEQFDSVIDTHLRGAFVMARAAQRPMVEQRYGKIVVVSSRSALGRRGQVNYSAAKAGLIGMVKTMAIELGPFGIHVNAVGPGHIETAMTRGIAERQGVDYEQIKADFASQSPLRRVGQPDDVARAIAFLASDAASYITGVTVWVAGGPVG